MTEECRWKALKWFLEESKAIRLAPRINGCEMKPEWAEALEACETAIEALEAVGRSEKCESD